MSQHPTVGLGMVLDRGVGELACNGWPEGRAGLWVWAQARF